MFVLFKSVKNQHTKKYMFNVQKSVYKVPGRHKKVEVVTRSRCLVFTIKTNN